MLDAEQKLKLLIQDRPWETEPDHKEWVDPKTKYKCEVKRHPELLHLCGYVTVPKKHHYYGRSYNHLRTGVHGGLTYSKDGKFGFDCSHAGDLSPGVLLSLLKVKDGLDPVMMRIDTYRTFGWVQDQTEWLANRLHEMDAELEDELVMRAAKKTVLSGLYSKMDEEYKKAKQAWLDSLEGE